MREEVKRIVKMVEEGKLSADDASELIEALEEAQRRLDPQEAEPNTESTHSSTDGADANAGTPPPPPGAEKKKPRDPFHELIDTIESIGRETAQAVDWNGLANTVRNTANKGVGAVKQAIKEAGKEGHWVFWGAGESRTVELPLSVPSGKKLRIINQCGDVLVTDAAPLGEVVANAKFKGATETESKRRADEYTLLIEEGETEITIRQPFLPNTSINLVVRLPEAVDVEISTESGSVAVTGMKSVNSNTKSGDISLVGCATVAAESMSGDINIEGATADVVAESKSGDIDVRGSTGGLNLKTTSGNIIASSVDSQSVNLQSVSGDIELGLEQGIRGNLNARTVSGDVRIALPDGGDARVALNTISGDVSFDSPVQEALQTDHRFTGKVGQGQGAIDVSSISGDIRVYMPVL